jgi:outer membrane receptor for ferrienterochelin and colicins
MKNLILSLGLVLLGNWSYAQFETQTVKGVVKSVATDSQPTEALPGAYVLWLGTDTSVAADLDGKFSISTVESTNKLVVSFVGFQSDTLIYKGESLLTIYLQSGEQLGEAKIVGERESTEMSLIDPLVSQTIGEQELCKAACCNLSEAFETNASVDASYTDAVTGTQQIRMLGLDGKYTQILKDNIPNVRGLSSIYGLTYIPGTWVDQIAISKGAGSVTSGYESITGQINVGMKSPDNAERMYINMYGNQGGRLELNAGFMQPVGEKWGTTLLTHGEYGNVRWDQNNDGFLDNPLKKDFILRNEWHYKGTRGLNGRYQVSWLEQENIAGQYDFRPNSEGPSQLWGAVINTSRLDASAKTGYVFQEKSWQSIGTQISSTWHRQNSTFGPTSYDGEQLSFRGNFLFQSRIGNDDHKFITGASFIYDDFNEKLDSVSYTRTEQVPGVFFEYTWTDLEVLSLVVGGRADYHNYYGLIATPRLHFRYSLTENSSIKLAAGRGFRTPNVIMENVGLLASSRTWDIQGDDSQPGFGLDPEIAWNGGITYLHKFKLNYRDASLSLDVYRTQFQNQMIVDLETAGVAKFYNLDGKSYSNSAQAEFSWSVFKRFDIRLAYRWLDVKATYGEDLIEKPLVASHRGFINLAYATRPGEKDQQWRFDVTSQVVGQKRIPNTQANPEEYELPAWSDPYVVVNAQVTRVFGPTFEIYLGAENLTNYRQPNAIIASEEPFGEHFDSSLIWGPVFGRMAYAGLRWKIE